MTIKPVKPNRTGITASTKHDDHVYHTGGAFIGSYSGRDGRTIHLELMGRIHHVDCDDCRVDAPVVPVERDVPITLTMIPRMVMRTKMDGSGFEFVTDYSGHKGQLQVGNVSIAFDGRNNFDPRNDHGEIDEYSETVVELSELRDDPVHHNGASVTGSVSAAEKILYALSKDLGYSIVRHEDVGCNDDDDRCSPEDFAELMAGFDTNESEGCNDNPHTVSREDYDNQTMKYNRLKNAARKVCDKLDDEPLWWVCTDKLNAALKNESEDCDG